MAAWLININMTADSKKLVYDWIHHTALVTNLHIIWLRQRHSCCNHFFFSCVSCGDHYCKWSSSPLSPFFGSWYLETCRSMQGHLSNGGSAIYMYTSHVHYTQTWTICGVGFCFRGRGPSNRTPSSPPPPPQLVPGFIFESRFHGMCCFKTLDLWSD